MPPKYPKTHARLYAKHTKEGPLTSDQCKEFIGWIEEPQGTDWKKEFVLKDTFGKKIRLTNNPKNRPFRRPLADRYASEHLRGKWALNLETIVIANTGNVLQGQHRFVGFILAEQLRGLEPKRWGTSALTYQTLIGFGVPQKPEVANTFDLGAKRSLGDVIYRHQAFGKGVSDKKQRGIANVLSGAIRLVWLRVGGKQVSFAPHFPHSEALEFYGEHPDILKAVTEITRLDDGEEGNEKSISSLLSLSYAAGLMYLMAGTVGGKTAIAFWEAFATGEGLKKGSPILALRQLLLRVDASSGSKRDEIIGAIIKTWLLWLTKKSATSKEIRVARKKSGDKFVLAEFPRIGGIDSDIEVETELTQHQLLVLSALKGKRKEVPYKYLQDRTGLQVGVLSNAIMAATKKGNENPHSLESRGFVSVAQYEPEEGQRGAAPYYFQLTAKGAKFTP